MSYSHHENRLHPEVDASFDPCLIPKRATNLQQARNRFGDAVDRCIPYLMQGDPLADELVHELYQQKAGSGNRLFNKALSDGIDSIYRPPSALEKFFRSVERVPPWVDWEQLELGGRVLLRPGALTLLSVAFGGLVVAYGSPGGNKPLMYTKELVRRAPKRLAETAIYMMQVCLPRGLERGNEGFNLSIRSRIVHASVRRLLLRSDWWKLDEWAMPINQLDMAGTNILFSLFLMRSLRRIGVLISKQEEEAVLSLWRYAGLIMGVDRELVVSNYNEGIRLSEIIEMINGPPDEDSRNLTDALVASYEGCLKMRYRVCHWLDCDLLLRGISRRVLGKSIADRLGMEATRLNALMPVIKLVVRTGSMVEKLLPFMGESFDRRGKEEWEAAIKLVLQGYEDSLTRLSPPTE